MGYRSEVGIKCREKAFELFRKAIIEHMFIPDEVYRNQYDEYTIVWSYVKWYDDYPEVSAIETVMRKLDGGSYRDDPEYGYRFCRIGEDPDDNEDRDNTYNIEFYIERTLSIEDGQKEIARSDLLRNT